MRWISVDERLPKPKKQRFKPVLFCVPDDGVCAGRYYFKNNTFVSLQGCIYELREVTHWAHMPPPPEPEQKVNY